MGCRISKHDSVSTITPEVNRSTSPQKYSNKNSTTSEMAKYKPDDNVDYKAKLERQLCLAKETPEPDFDLSDCGLKQVPSGVFIVCRVLRKEILNLSKNRLNTLNGGGSIADLLLLTTLDLRFNGFKKLPDDIHRLENLKELLISNNQLTKLPTTINQLRKLELFDCSNNQLIDLTEINCMSALRIINLTGNFNLIKLPSELSTCESLVDIIFDIDIIKSPPINILERGTLDILNYLMSNGELFADESITMDSEDEQRLRRQQLQIQREQKRKIEMDFIEQERQNGGRGGGGSNKNDVDKYSKEKKFIEQERLQLEKNSQFEAELHQKQQKRREELLQQLVQQQTENDTLVSKVQQEKDSERSKLIGDILKAEENSAIVVNNLLALKSNEPDSTLLEQENREKEYILEQLRLQHSDLRKQEVLSAMTDILVNEQRTIDEYQQKRDATAKDILQRDQIAVEQLTNVYRSNDQNRTMAVIKIMQNEELQKVAVCSLISKNDSRTWALVEQVRIVEAQLAEMTRMEIERRKLSVDERMSDLSDQRMNLTYVLLDLLEQQEKRKNQLLETLAYMEKQKETEQQDFWLLQYQKLLDSQPAELSNKSINLDPLFGYTLLVNGVVHCLPFLSKLWQTKQKDLIEITDSDLEMAGVKKSNDRLAIIRSIEEYLHNSDIRGRQPSAPPPRQNSNTDDSYGSGSGGCKEEYSDSDVKEQSSPSSPLPPAYQQLSPQSLEIVNTDQKTDGQFETLTECVVCMEKSCKIIFLPCGHLCCCQDCHETLTLCPMCRSTIERRIKIIQP